MSCEFALCQRKNGPPETPVSILCDENGTELFGHGHKPLCSIACPWVHRQPAVGTLASSPAIAVADANPIHDRAIAPKVLEHPLLLLKEVAQQHVVRTLHHGAVGEMVGPEKCRARDEKPACREPDRLCHPFLGHEPGARAQEVPQFGGMMADVEDMPGDIEWVIRLQESEQFPVPTREDVRIVVHPEHIGRGRDLDEHAHHRILVDVFRGLHEGVESSVIQKFPHGCDGLRAARVAPGINLERAAVRGVIDHTFHRANGVLRMISVAPHQD